MRLRVIVLAIAGFEALFLLAMLVGAMVFMLPAAGDNLTAAIMMILPSLFFLLTLPALILGLLGKALKTALVMSLVLLVAFLLFFGINLTSDPAVTVAPDTPFGSP